MGTWIDFKQLREQVDFAKVLDYYKVQYKRKGSQAQAFCPLPGHQGNKKSPSFSVSFEKRIFQCFGCGTKGNVLDFVAYMEGLDPQDPGEFRNAAILAQERFGAAASPAKPMGKSNRQVEPSPSVPQRAPEAPKAQRVIINEPLDFELKNLDPKPAYLLNRGFTERTIAHFGLGYCSKGLFAGRIAIPLHDPKGRLIGYAGRLIYDDALDDENPKYLFPSKRERNGKSLEFAKSLFVYNGHRIQAPVHDLVVVEGFPSVWWLFQSGFSDVVALMGSSCSVDQAKLIVDLVHRNGRVWILTDGDKAGDRCAHDIFEDVGSRRFCLWVRLSEGQPTDFSPEDLGAMLEWKISA
jgi:DNA primase